MIELKISDAIDAVRKNLDEVNANASEMYGISDTDNTDLDNIISRTIPDAVNAVNAAAPSALLQGIILKPERQSEQSYVSDFEKLTINNRAVSFSFEKRCLRIVAVRAFDSDVIVSDEVPEVSPEGRMQLNPFARGTFDNPALVRLQSPDNTTGYRYYSLLEDNSSFDLETWLEEHGQSDRQPFPLSLVEYMPVCEFESGTLYHEAEGTKPAYYDVPDRLRETIIYQLTGMVLAIYKEDEKASYFFNLTGLTSSNNE